MTKRKTKVSKKRKKITGYATGLTTKDLCPALNFGSKDDRVDALSKSALFYDKESVEKLKGNTPGSWVNYKVNFTTTPRPNAPHTFTQQDVFKALQDFGNDVMDLIDASISNDRQRKAFKKFVSASYERGMLHAKQLGRKAGTTLFRYEDITPVLKNTEDSNASLHTS